MAQFATSEDIKAVYELPIPDVVVPRVEALLDKAELRLLQRVPSITQRVGLDPADPRYLDRALVRGVLEDIVLRVMRNPNGYVQEQAGAFMYRIDRALASDSVHPSEDDLTPLWPPARSSAPRAIQMGLPAWRIP